MSERRLLLHNMAEAQAIVLPSGYEDEFVNAVEEDLLCSICHLALKEAVQTGKCGHRFCMQCLDEHFRRFVIQSVVGKLLNVRVLYAIRYSVYPEVTIFEPPLAST